MPRSYPSFRCLRLAVAVCAAVLAHCQGGLFAQSHDVEGEANGIAAANQVLRAQILNRAPGVSRRAADAGLIDTLTQRKAQVQHMMMVHPGRALQVFFAAQEIQSLRERASIPEGLLEEVHTLRGHPSVTIADSADASTSTHIYSLNDGGGTIEAYQDSESAPNVQCGDSVVLHGYLLDRTMAVSAASVEHAATPACAPLGEQKIAVLLLNMPGQGTQVTAEQVDSIYFGTSGKTIVNHTAEQSYGKASVSGKVFGPYMLDRKYTCGENNLIRTAALALADQDVKFSDYTQFHMVLPSLSGGCGWAGVGSVGCGLVSTPTQSGVQIGYAWVLAPTLSELLRVAPHELGHNYGLGHARTVNFPLANVGPDRSTAQYSEYGDPFSVMGAGTGDYSFAAQHKVRMQWLNIGDDVIEVQDSGTFTILPLESSDSGPKALRIRRKLDREEWLWLEFRQPLGSFDSQTTASLQNVFSGAVIRAEAPETGRYSEFLNFLPSIPAGVTGFNPTTSAAAGVVRNGSTWSDPYSGLTLQVTNASPGGLTVAVNYDGACASFERTGSSFDPNSPPLNLSISADASCSWSVSGNNYWITPQTGQSGQGGGAATIALDSNQTNFARSGSYTINRQTTYITQQPAQQPPQVLSVSPTAGSVPNLHFIPVEIITSDPNGHADLNQLQVLINTTQTPSQGCYFRYDYGSQTLTLVADDGVTDQPKTVHVGDSFAIANSTCALGGISDVYLNETDDRLVVQVDFRNISAVPLQIFTSLTDSTAQPPSFTQAGQFKVAAVCTPIPSQALVRAVAETNTYVVFVDAGTCDWTASTQTPWITISNASNNGRTSVRFNLDENTDTAPRIGTIQLGDQMITVAQSGAGQDAGYVTLQPIESHMPFNGGSGSFEVIPHGAASYTWDAGADQDWITLVKVNTPSGISNGSVFFSVDRNTTGGVRTGTISVGDKKFGIRQDPQPQ